MSGNAAAFKKLEGLIGKLGALNALPDEIASAMVAPLKKQLTANIAAGVDPAGKPWPLTAYGKQALKGAAKALTVTSRGPVVIAKLQGVEARHNYGNVQGKVRRQILPSRRVGMKGVVKILSKIAKAKFKELAAE